MKKSGGSNITFFPIKVYRMIQAFNINVDDKRPSQNDLLNL